MSQDDEQDLAKRLYTHVDRLAGLIGLRHLAKSNTMEVTALPRSATCAPGDSVGHFDEASSGLQRLTAEA